MKSTFLFPYYVLNENYYLKAAENRFERLADMFVKSFTQKWVTFFWIDFVQASVVTDYSINLFPSLTNFFTMTQATEKCQMVWDEKNNSFLSVSSECLFVKFYCVNQFV